MDGTLRRMAKSKGPTEQVRLPADLLEVVRATSPALGEQPGDYIARVVREALKKDIPRAAKALSRRAQQSGAPEEAE